MFAVEPWLYWTIMGAFDLIVAAIAVALFWDAERGSGCR